MKNLLSKKFSTTLNALLFALVAFSVVGVVSAAAPNPGHNYSEVGGGVVQGDLVYGSAADTLSVLAKNTSATRYLSNTGSSNNPAWAQIDLTNGVTGILPAANGGSGNGFFAVTGPTTSTKTFTFPNASATVLTSDAAVTVGQGGTGAAPGADDQVLVSDSTSAATWRTINDCQGTAKALTYTQSSNTIGCNTITNALLNSTNHTDTTTGTVARGDVITGQGASATWTRLAKGTANQVLSMDSSGTDVAWATRPGYSLSVQALTSSPTDAQTVYIGQLPKAPQTTAAISKIYIPKTGTITRAQMYVYSGTAGTNEAWSLYVRLNNTTDTLIQTVSAATNERVFSNTGLSIAVTAGDYIEIKGVQPTWATNPATTIYGGYVWIE